MEYGQISLPSKQESGQSCLRSESYILNLRQWSSSRVSCIENSKVLPVPLLFFLFSLFFLLLGAFSRKSSDMMTSASIHNRIDGVHFYLPLLFYKILYPLLLSVFFRLAFSPPLITNTENCFWSILWCNANFYVSFNWWLDFLFHSIPINLNMHYRVQIKLVL